MMPSPNADAQPETRVDQGEARQVTADPVTDLLHRSGGQADVVVTEEPNDSVAESLAAHEHEQDQDEYKAANPQEFQVGPNSRTDLRQQRGLRHDLNLGDRLARPGYRRDSPSSPSLHRPSLSTGISSKVYPGWSFD